MLGCEFAASYFVGRGNEASLEHTVVTTKSRDIYYIPFDYTPSVSVTIDRTLPPELTVTTRISATTMSMLESEMDASSKELDTFLEQFIRSESV